MITCTIRARRLSPDCTGWYLLWWTRRLNTWSFDRATHEPADVPCIIRNIQAGDEVWLVAYEHAPEGTRSWHAIETYYLEDGASYIFDYQQGVLSKEGAKEGGKGFSPLWLILPTAAGLGALILAGKRR